MTDDQAQQYEVLPVEKVFPGWVRPLNADGSTPRGRLSKAAKQDKAAYEGQARQYGVALDALKAVSDTLAAERTNLADARREIETLRAAHGTLTAALATANEQTAAKRREAEAAKLDAKANADRDHYADLVSNQLSRLTGRQLARMKAEKYFVVYGDEDYSITVHTLAGAQRLEIADSTVRLISLSSAGDDNPFDLLHVQTFNLEQQGLSAEACYGIAALLEIPLKQLRKRAPKHVVRKVWQTTNQPRGKKKVLSLHNEAQDRLRKENMASAIGAIAMASVVERSPGAAFLGMTYKANSEGIIGPGFSPRP